MSRGASDPDTVQRRRFLTAALGAAGAGIVVGALGSEAARGDDDDAPAPMGSPPFGPGAQIVLDPDGVDGPSLATTWERMIDLIAQSPGPHTIAVAGDVTAPRGTWDLGQGMVTFQSMPGRDWFLGGPTLTMADGCVFDPPPSVLVADLGLLMLSTSRSPIMSHYARDGAPLMTTCISANRGGAFASEYHPILYIDNYDTADPPNRVYEEPMPLAAVIVVLDQGRFLNGPDGEQNVDEGHAPLVEARGGVIACNLGPGVAMITDDIFTGDGDAYYFINSTAVPWYRIENPTLTGEQTWTLDTRAASLGYSPTVAGHWGEPASPPIDAQSAIDELAARVASLEAAARS